MIWSMGDQVSAMFKMIKPLDFTLWKVPRKGGDEKSLREIYSPEGFKAGGAFLGQKVGTSGAHFFGGLGEGLKEGVFPKGVKVLDAGKDAGGGLVNITIPELVIPPFPKIPEFPKLPTLPEGGLVQIPKVDMPFGDVQMPSLAPFDDEGAPNYLVLGGLALVAYTVLTGRKG